MEKKTKILTFAAVALMFAVCFIGFVAINDGEVDAEDAEGGSSATTVDLLSGMYGAEEMTFEAGKYTLTGDVTITLTKDLTGDNGLKGVKFVGAHTLTITSANEGHYTLDVTYDFGTKIKDDAGRIFQVSNFVLENASLNVVQLDDKKTIDDNQPGGSVFGEAQVTVQGKSTMTITTNEYANRVFYNNNSSMSIIGGNAKVILNNASSLTASLSMTDGAILEINNPINTAGNFYPNIISNTGNKCSITVNGASNGNHGLFFYGSNAKGGPAGVLKNCSVTTDGIIGFYSHQSVDATGSEFEAKELVVAKSGAANMANVKGAMFNVAKVGAIDPLSEYKPVNEKKLYLDGVTFNGNTVIGSGASLCVEKGKTLTVAKGATISVFGTIDNKGTIVNNGTIIVNDAAGLKTAVAAGGKISLANDIEITDNDGTINNNGLNITKCVEIDGNDKKISFTDNETIYGLVFSKGCGGSKLSNVSLDFGGIAKYGLCIRNMSEGNGITVENVTIDNYGKTGIDLNGVCGEIKLKNVDVKGNGHYVGTDTNLTRGHGYALVIDDIKDGASVTTENCTIASVNVHNFCGKIHDVDLSGCNGLLFVSVEDGSNSTLTSVYDDGIDHKKQTSKGTIINTEGSSKGLLKDGIVKFPTEFNKNKHAIFDTVKNESGKVKEKGGPFDVLRAYRVCYGLAFFDANVNIVKDYEINCDAIIPDDVIVTIGESGKLIISDGVKLYNKGTINTTATDKLDIKGKLIMEAGSTLTVGSSNVIGAGAFDLKTGELEINTNSKGGFDATLNGKATASKLDVWINDTFTVAKGAELTMTGTFLNAGNVTIDGTLLMTDAGKLQVMKNGIVTINGTIDGGIIDITNVDKDVVCVLFKPNSTITSKIDGTDDGKTSIVVLFGIKAGKGGVSVTKGSVIVDGALVEGDVTVPSGSTSFVYGTLEPGATLTIENNAAVNPTGSGSLVVESGAKVVTNSGASIKSVTYKAGSELNGTTFDTDTRVTPEGNVLVAIKIYLNYDNKKLNVSADYVEAFAGDKYVDVLSGVTVSGVNSRITFSGWYNTLNEKITSSATVPDVAGDVELFAHFDEVAKQIPAKVDSDNGNGVNDYSLVIAITVLVASIGFLACVIKKR
ncbi:MAG: hypothetical protein SPC89_05470 [Candidatus Methanarcanum hacksteinii]|nr:hypothetical protein [Candidatus Methanarcanum hacksteinii]